MEQRRSCNAERHRRAQAVNTEIDRNLARSNEILNELQVLYDQIGEALAAERRERNDHSV